MTASSRFNFSQSSSASSARALSVCSLLAISVSRVSGFFIVVLRFMVSRVLEYFHHCWGRKALTLTLSQRERGNVVVFHTNRTTKKKRPVYAVIRYNNTNKLMHERGRYSTPSRRTLENITIFGYPINLFCSPFFQYATGSDNTCRASANSVAC